MHVTTVELVRKLSTESRDCIRIRLLFRTDRISRAVSQFYFTLLNEGARVKLKQREYIRSKDDGKLAFYYPFLISHVKTLHECKVAEINIPTKRSLGFSPTVHRD